MSPDPLSDVLDLADARCVLTGTLLGGGTWAQKFQRSDAVKFLAVARGRCWLTTEGGSTAPVPFGAGDVVITNGAPSIILASTAEGLTEASSSPLDRDRDGNLLVGAGSDFMMIGGLLEVDELRAGFLRESLPQLIYVSGQEAEAAKLRWLLSELATESSSKRPGAANAVALLAKLLFVEALRLHIEGGKQDRTGWLTALEDRRISIALRGIHADPSHAWTLEELAKLSGMSRTTFAVRFREAVGVPPLTYVLNWRMRLAERDLAETDHSVADIAWSLGYGSESAFSNAFSRATGRSPGRFRKEAMRPAPERRTKGASREVELE